MMAELTYKTLAELVFRTASEQAQLLQVRPKNFFLDLTTVMVWGVNYGRYFNGDALTRHSFFATNFNPRAPGRRASMGVLREQCLALVKKGKKRYAVNGCTISGCGTLTHRPDTGTDESSWRQRSRPDTWCGLVTPDYAWYQDVVSELTLDSRGTRMCFEANSRYSVLEILITVSAGQIEYSSACLNAAFSAVRKLICDVRNATGDRRVDVVYPQFELSASTGTNGVTEEKYPA